MTLRHGVSAALLILAGVGWAYNPPPRLAARRASVAVSCVSLGVGALAVGVWAGRRAARTDRQA
jgi:hypothetical protein